jgi:predicted alpha/beta superfamily hydrolase
MKTLLSFLLLFPMLVCAQNDAPLTVAGGKVVRYENFPSQYGILPRNVDVWLPSGYDTQKRYAVLYMHDGQMLFDSTTTWNKQEWGVDETVSKLMQEQKIKDCIVVGVWNSATRHSDYFPQKAFESLSQSEQDSLIKVKRNPEAGAPLLSGGLRADNYLKFLVTELKPFIDKTYATLPGKEHTFVAGSSMGGLISMYAICEYPQVFGGAACISTHWLGFFNDKNNPIPKAFIAYLEKHLPAPKDNKIYFDYGTVGLDGYYPKYQKKADAVMKKKGYHKHLWMTKGFKKEDHSERAWRSRLHIPLTFLMHP